ncbi:hypothetical protein [Nannocystis radixulma]|uniref:Secreted protein n=1 Tax=Nannocystis radixulma TaxID=2995305 RepID=A0ABT5BLN3_9BACT|nr:hypothetical protein [Nannocystis radixulma]MDC0675049.1 hypothetical protein [Nannocystis radixulma]
MLRKIAILFPVLAFALPLVAASPASAADPWQVGKHDQVWPDNQTYPDQWEPIDQIDQIKPIVPDDPCELVKECPDPETCAWECECYYVNPCTGEVVGNLPDLPDLPVYPDDLDL